MRLAVDVGQPVIDRLMGRDVLEEVEFPTHVGVDGFDFAEVLANDMFDIRFPELFENEQTQCATTRGDTESAYPFRTAGDDCSLLLFIKVSQTANSLDAMCIVPP